ncbi:MAG: cache domain-containing protein [Sedimentisphaerales bacterium]|nr:cache domain-containing protein [Sedimentisphaerales bacterium]
MKLQTTFNLGITFIFIVLAISIAALSIQYVNTNTIREARNHVTIYTRAAWEIHNSQIAQIQAALEVMAYSDSLGELLEHPEDEPLRRAVMADLEGARQELGMDILNVLSSDGAVILRSRYPYNHGDNFYNDPLVRHVMVEGRSISGNVIFSQERLDVEGEGLLERVLAIAQEPRGMFIGAAVPVIRDGEMIGILEMGTLLNGAVEEVDRIRDAVFASETYAEKPLGTVTIFMGDLRISTNVLDNQGRRAVGTRASQEVAEQVLQAGEPWTGRAYVVDTWYLSQYEPIRDPDGEIIGMFYVGELEQKYLDIRQQAVVLYLAVVLSGMLVAFLIFYFLTRGVVRPILQLSVATQQLSQGDLTYRVDIHRDDELGDLAVSFNAMADQLEMQRHQIEEDQRRLEDLNSELRTTNRNYMEMLGFVSHELKNPLSSAILSLYTVKDGYLGKITDVQERSLASVARSLEYFQDMVKNYLDLSRLEKGELKARKHDIDLRAQVIEPVLDGLRKGLEDKGMSVVNNVVEGLRITADGTLIRIVYDNLLSNAIKYGKEGGRVELDTRRDEGAITLRVYNEGPGIPASEIPKLFEKFSRLEHPEYIREKGTGLGLFICREIVEEHGGKIWVDSEEGQWVRFSFTLPNN